MLLLTVLIFQQSVSFMRGIFDKFHTNMFLPTGNCWIWHWSGSNGEFGYLLYRLHKTWTF